jgi:group II intron reverse transcriptase/maturase
MLNSPTQPPKTAPAPPDMAACRAMVRERREYLSAKSQQFQQVANLIHFLDPTLLKVAGNRLRLGAAPGVDQVTPSRYRRNLDHNINQLITEVQHKSYQPWPARRVSIPKDDGSERHLGLPATRDKHLQGAVLVLLEAIYEPHFYDHSYGFRPHRSAKKALRVLLDWITDHEGAWVLEVDLSKFFDTIPHDQLLDVISEKVGDRVIRHLLQAWLKAGVMDGDVLVPSERGTPQGGVITPPTMLQNIFSNS